MLSVWSEMDGTPRRVAVAQDSYSKNAVTIY